MFSLDNVIDDLWPEARPAPWQKKVLRKLLHEEEFQQFAARHRHLKGLDTVEQVLEHLNIHCQIRSVVWNKFPNKGRWLSSPTTLPAHSTAWPCYTPFLAFAAMLKSSPTACSLISNRSVRCLFRWIISMAAPLKRRYS